MAFNPDFRSLEDYLNKALQYYDLPGLAVLVSTEQTTFTKAIGYRDSLSKDPLKPEHIFHMASVTKLFVGTSILQLWEKGLVELDMPLVEILPWFCMADPRHRTITLRQLLSHTAGLPDVVDYHWESPEVDEQALERYVRSSEVTEAHLLWDPREGRFSYSNLGYEILGVAVAEVTGLSFEDWVKQSIFSPLGMKESTLLTFERSMDQVCVPHIKNEQRETIHAPHFPYNRAHGPSSTLTSNLSDLLKFAKAQLHQTLLLRETVELAWTPMARVPNNGEQIGLSWFTREQRGYRFHGHEGTDDGFRASFWLCPDLDLSIIVCSNQSDAPVKKINKKVFDLLLGEPLPSAY